MDTGNLDYDSADVMPVSDTCVAHESLMLMLDAAWML